MLLAGRTLAGLSDDKHFAWVPECGQEFNAVCSDKHRILDVISGIRLLGMGWFD